MYRVLLTLFLLAALTLEVRAELLVTMGDSTTENNFKTTPAYPSLLAPELPGWTVTNLGLSGETSAGGLAKINSVVNLHPQIVIIQYGGGDSFWEPGASGPNVTVANFLTNLTGMVNSLQSAGIKPILMTPDPFLLPNPPLTYGPYASQTPNDLVEQYAAATRTLAGQLHVPLVDAYAAMQTALGKLAIENSPLYYDYRHPTTAGEAIVKAAVAPVLFAQVPEPGGFWLGLAGTAALAAPIRRRLCRGRREGD